MNPYGLPSKDERPHAAKTAPAKDRDALREFADSHPFCQCCGDDRRALHIHHIIGGRGGRSDEHVNLLRLCFNPCHNLADGLSVREEMRDDETLGDLFPKLPLAVQLSLKIRAGELDAAGMERLAVLHGRCLPFPAPIPETFRVLYTKNREGR